MIKTLTLALSLAILIQNTCPIGLAAKTGFASPHGHCCCAGNDAKNTGETHKDGKQALSVKGPTFVFIAQKETLPCSFCVLKRTDGISRDTLYRSITLNPPEEPPRIS